MAVPKHILRIHDTEANLLASLKDTQIAYATDIDEAIWRNGTYFHYLASGKAWNGSSYDYSNIDATSITIHDGGGNTTILNYASLLTETFEINQASDFKTALESTINRKTLIMNERSIYYTTNNTINVYGINVLIGHDVDISTGVGITADFTENVGSPSTSIICHNTTFSLGLTGGLDFDGDIDIDIFARHFDTTITNLDGLGTIKYEKTDSTLPTTGTYTITQSFWDSTAGVGGDVFLANTQTFTGVNTFSEDILLNKSSGFTKIDSSGGSTLQIGLPLLAIMQIDPTINTIRFKRNDDTILNLGTLIFSSLPNVIRNTLNSAVDTDIALEVQKIDTTSTFSVTGEGKVLATSVNGVPLTSGGSATNFLSEDGTYSVPSGIGDAVLANTQTFTGVNTFSDEVLVEKKINFNPHNPSTKTLGDLWFGATYSDFKAYYLGAERLINSSVLLVSNETNVRNYPFGLSLSNQNLTMTNAPLGISTGAGAYHQIEKKLHETSTSVFTLWFTDTKANRVFYQSVNLGVYADWVEIGNTPKIGTIASSSSLTIDASVTDQYNVTTLASALTINAPTNPTDGQKLTIRIKDNGVTKTLTWNAIFRAIGTTLPNPTTANKTIYVGCIYNSDDTKWDVVAVSEEA